MRQIRPDFTVLEARQMAPKLYLIAKYAMESRIKLPESEHVQSGYTYHFDNDNASHLPSVVPESFAESVHISTACGNLLKSLNVDDEDEDYEPAVSLSDNKLSVDRTNFKNLDEDPSQKDVCNLISHAAEVLKAQIDMDIALQSQLPSEVDVEEDLAISREAVAAELRGERLPVRQWTPSMA
ncbi:hypothetical protein HDV05_006875 [Chytridiales sp. JEL 0842]|nr:hypothetical protein HDV05_006875 [Chytridiales sp. JEL 0842]